MIVLVTGGARSGKSRFAEQYAQKLGTDGIYVSTAEARDQEMQERIDEHIKRREQMGFAWESIEEPLQLIEQLNQIRLESRSEKAKQRIILVDCLTIWLSNGLLLSEEQPDAWKPADQIKALTDVLQGMDHHVILVTNEVGDGVVPAYPLGRLFRDWAGRLNQQVAAVSEQVFLVTAGIPIELKSRAFRWEDAEH